MCVGCREMRDKRDLIRIVRVEDGAVFDGTGKKPGRGAYICKNQECLDKASENIKVEINPEIIDDEVHRMMHQFEQQIQMQGINLEQYMQFTGQTHDDFHKQLEPEAIKRLKSRYLLEEIAKAEDITISDEEAEAEAAHMAEHYGITKDELLMEFGGLEIVKYDMKMRKAMEILKNNN